MDFLVCSDALARGIDIESRIDFVISYDAPQYLKTYIHRVGRTARAGASGEAFTIVDGVKGERKFKALLKEGQIQVEMFPVPEKLVGEENFGEILKLAKESLAEEKKSEKKGRDRSKKWWNVY